MAQHPEQAKPPEQLCSGWLRMLKPGACLSRLSHGSWITIEPRMKSTRDFMVNSIVLFHYDRHYYSLVYVSPDPST
jgi:hypothetical protein